MCLRLCWHLGIIFSIFSFLITCISFAFRRFWVHVHIYLRAWQWISSCISFEVSSKSFVFLGKFYLLVLFYWAHPVISASNFERPVCFLMPLLTRLFSGTYVTVYIGWLYLNWKQMRSWYIEYLTKGSFMYIFICMILTPVLFF